MRDDLLLPYLNDHLGGSVSAIEMIGARLDQSPESDVAPMLRELLPEIERDQATLEALIHAARGEENMLKRAAGWIAEKVTRPMRRGRGREEEKGIFQELEALVLGIWGKRALWRAMDALYRDDSRFSSFDFAALERRAQQQHDRVERARLEEARRAFSGG